MNYTTYLFDFDYTLADSSRGIVTCFRNVLTRHGYTEVTDDDIKRTIEMCIRDRPVVVNPGTGLVCLLETTDLVLSLIHIFLPAYHKEW